MRIASGLDVRAFGVVPLPGTGAAGGASFTLAVLIVFGNTGVVEMSERNGERRRSAQLTVQHQDVRRSAQWAVLLGGGLILVRIDFC